MIRFLLTLAMALLSSTWAPCACALEAATARSLASGDNDARVEALHKALAAGDSALAPFLQSLLDDEVKLDASHVYLVHGGATADAATGAAVALPEGVEDVVNNNRMRREIESALASMKLLSPDAGLRSKALSGLEAEPDPAQLAMVQRALAQETDASLKPRLQALASAMQLVSGDRAQRLAAATALASSDLPSTQALLLERLAPNGESDAEVRARLERALDAVRSRLAWGERLGLVFSGLSLGSILLLAALGLAICYGLMGVINMAHGELIMVGAYATYVVQNFFRDHLPASAFDAYIVAAVPASFFASAFVGAVLERGVIRWLYGRPLETLLATWGISLALMQAVRSIFGAQNVQVENPSFLSGGVAVMSNLTLPYNRLAILAFAALVLAGVALLISRTRLGLFVRGVTQNRRMAACVGVNTARVDTLAFSLGAGLAGLAGCALSQVGNVGPDLGQGYIVDSFMVVVLGGVGQLTGTVVAALGLGVLNKLLEGFAGAVLAKIMVLVFIVVFIQKRPQGLFAIKGRSAEA